MSGVALTFDDGPDPDLTPRLLDLLSELGVPATFFPIAPRAAAHPELIARMRRDGHAIGLHCEEHVRHTDRDQRWVETDTATALGRLVRLGVRPRWWRPPWGRTADFTQAVADAHGLRLVGWSVDTHDWRGDTAEAMLDATQPGLRPGAIVLAHDGIGPGAQRTDARETVRYVDLAVDLVRRAGAPFVPLSLG
jgi:peptidoglycan/xylan/chitin deacetylase (PgdA/CDA1 family)